jgi:RNA polymerase sigma-70 factor (ECF subfamily)
MESSDAGIVRRVRAGDVGAYRLIVDRHYERCLRYSMRMLGNRADAEEVVQDAFVRAYRYLASYDEALAFGGWIMQITVNEVRKASARQQRDDRRLVSLDAAVDFVAPGGGAHSHVAADVQWALAQLAPAHREALILKFVNDLTYESISEITGLAVPALKMRVKRARKHMEVLLEEWKNA